MKLRDAMKRIFDEDGNFRKGFDPYREDEDHPWMVVLFDDGELKHEVMTELRRSMNSGTYGWDCSMSQMYHAGNFSMNTKGNYSTIYYWR